VIASGSHELAADVDDIEVIRMEMVDPKARVGDPVLGWIAEDVGAGFVDVGEGEGLGIGRPDDGGDRVEDVRVTVRYRQETGHGTDSRGSLMRTACQRRRFP
jgi:hypothetical protein